MYDGHVETGDGHYGKGTEGKEVQVVVGSLSQTGYSQDSVTDDVGDGDYGHQNGTAKEDVEAFCHGVQTWFVVPFLVWFFGYAKGGIEKGHYSDDDHVHYGQQQCQPELGTL